MHARFVALAVVITLLGPSLAAAACAWTCSGEHHTRAATDTCEEHGAQHDAPALTPGRDCHDVADTPVLVRPASAPEWNLAVAAIPVAFGITADDRRRASSPHHLLTAPPGPSRVVPPLRI